MNDVSAILDRGRRYPDEEVEPVSVNEIREFQSAFQDHIPRSYLDFVELGGHAELGFSNRVLSPSEIIEARKYVGSEYLPFAENGCGDLFVWRVEDLPQSSVYFWDHETETYQKHRESFLECIDEWRTGHGHAT